MEFVNGSSPGGRDFGLNARFRPDHQAELYARAGIIEHWVVDIAARRLIMHREPLEGQYRSVIAYSDDESVAALCAPRAVFNAAAAF